MRSASRSDLRAIRPGGNPFVAGFIAVALVFAATSTRADFKDGLDGYNRGDFAAALREWRPLAEGGSAQAQTALGEMYFSGRGVPKDRAEAATWLRKAAKQGHVSAQYALAQMYMHGEGVPRDSLQAYAWLERATNGAQGFTRNVFAQLRDDLAKTMTSEQITEAQRLAEKWKAGGN